MLEIINKSSSCVGLYPVYANNGQHQLTLVIKSSFKFDANGKLQQLTPPLEIQETDEYANEPGDSSLT